MKKAICLLMMFLAAGCSNSYTEGNYPVRPPELMDCKIYKLYNNTGGVITVVRCPNSTTSTTYSSGKSTNYSVVVDK